MPREDGATVKSVATTEDSIVFEFDRGDAVDASDDWQSLDDGVDYLLCLFELGGRETTSLRQMLDESDEDVPEPPRRSSA